MKKISLPPQYSNIISIENLLAAWKEFAKGKRDRKDVQEFERNLMSQIISLHRELAAKTYHHSAYESFSISDPKPRSIHKAKVRDRVLHRAFYLILCPFFDRTFISDSFSCRLDKGTHKARERFVQFSRRVSKNHTRTVWILKCDIKKFFASIDHAILISILERHIFDRDITDLLGKIISSFNSGVIGTGLPLGNLTSQLFANIYLNELDQFIKHQLKLKYYVRYADDFVILHHDRNHLLQILPAINSFLLEKLKLTLHPDKVFIKTLASGVDFLGWIHFPDHRVLRGATRRRMFRNLAAKKDNEEAVASYLGMLKHGNAHTLRGKVLRCFSMRGFTLIELLIVLAIGGIIVGTVGPAISQFPSGSQLDEVAGDLKQTIQLARERSVAGLANSVHGVFLESNAGIPDRYILFRGATYAIRDPIFDQVTSLRTSIELDTALVGGVSEITFAPRWGTPSATGTITLIHSTGATRILRLNDLGLIVSD